MFQDGQTATNPTTGEKVVLQGGQWVPMGGKPPAPRPQTPGIIYGRPKPVDPVEQERLTLARNADARAAEDQARQNRNDQRGTIPAGYERKPDGSVAPMAGYDPAKSAKPNEGEMKAASFLTRALGANTSYEGADIGPRSYVGETLNSVAPGLLNQLPASVGNSPERQIADSAQREFIAATLRQDSGAAIPDAEIENQRRIYFPVAGDGPEVIAQKRAARLRAIAGLKESAGAALGDEQKKILEKFDPDIQAAVRGEAPAQGGALDIKFNDEQSPATGSRMSTAQENEINAALRTGDQGQVLALFQRYTGNPPTPATIASVQAAIAAIKKNPEAKLAVSYGDVDAAAQSVSDKERFGDNLKPAMEARKDLIADPIVRGVADIVPFMDEISAGANTLFGGGTYADNVRKERAIDEADNRVNPRLRVAGQLLGAAVPVGRVLGFGRGASGVARSAASYGAESGTMGALYAAGKADPNPDASTGEAFGKRASAAPLGAFIGGATGYGLARLAARWANRGGGNNPPGGGGASDIARAAADENIPISRPIVDPSRRDAMSYLESSIGSGGPIRRSLEATRAGLEDRATDLGAAGIDQATGVMGERVQQAGRNYITRSRGIGGRLYDRADQMAGAQPIRPREALRVLDQHLAELERNANTNAPLIRYMQEIRGDLVDDAGSLVHKRIGDIRDLRTQMRGNINNRNLTATDAERRIGEVLDGASVDIQRDLRNTPAAIRQYQRADRFWRERQSEIKQVVQRVIGPRDNPLSGEQAWQRLRTMASDKGDSARLARVWEKLAPEDRADAAATIASSLGRRSPEEAFSPALFVNSVRGLSEPARRTIFGPEGARSINNLRRVAEAYRDTAARLNNSRSGQVMQWGKFLSTFAIGTGGGGAVGGIPGAVAGAGVTGAGALARNLSARALMSPDMSRWLANAPRQTTPSAIRRYVSEGLSTVARRDPAIAQDVLGLQRALNDAFAQVPLRAAARDEEAQRREVPVQR